MAKETLDPLALTLATSGGMPPNLAKKLEDYLTKVTERQQLDALKDEEERASLEAKVKHRQIIAARSAEMREKERLKQEAAQSRCSHGSLSVTGMLRTLIAGWRTGPGTWALRCQSCGKEYTDLRQVPVHLVPANDRIGGPKNY